MMIYRTTCLSKYFCILVISLAVVVSSESNNINNESYSPLSLSTLSSSKQAPQQQKQEQQHHYTPRHSRNLSDFDEINAILQDIRVDLPDVRLSEGRTTVELSNIVCFDLQVQDIELTSTPQSSTNTELDLTVMNLDMSCVASYEYDGFLIRGSGTVDITSLGNDAVVKGLVGTSGSSGSSSGFIRDPPNNIDVSQCNPFINVNDMNFRGGGLFGWVLDLVEPLLRNAMERAAEDEICQELRAAMERAEGFLDIAKTTLEQYDPASLGPLDPLELENELRRETTVTSTKLLDFLDDETDVVRWIRTGLEKSIGFLTNVEADPNTGRPDLKANILLREYLLDDDGALVLDMGDDLILFQGHDIVTETTIRLDRARLVGLDTLIELEALNMIGHHTLQNQLGWEYLGFVLDMTIDIKPSTLEDSIVDGSSDTQILEQVQLFVAIDDLSANVAVLAALDQGLLEHLRLGSLLQSSNLVPCMGSTVVQMEVATFSAQANDIATPTLDGFVSPGLDRLFTDAMDAAFHMYEDIVLEASPSFFQTTVRPILNERFLNDKSFGMDSTSSCPPPSSGGSNNNGDGDELVDLRDLLLTPDKALQVGAAGNEPYGDLFSSFVMPSLRDEIFQADYFNTRLVRPITKEQSGVEGRLAFPKMVLFDYFDTSSSSVLYEELEFTVSNLRLNNLDIVAQNSIALLEPRDWNLLSNTIELDDEVGNRHLNVTASVLLSVRGDDSPLAMSNQVDFSLSIPRSSFSVEVLAALQETALLNFPVNDVTNIYCWLAALGTDGSDATSLQRRGLLKGLDLSSLSLFVSTFSLDANCVSCSSPGGNYISQILKDLERGGLAFNFKDPIVRLMQEVAWGYWQNFDLDRFLLQAPAYCPHHPTYAPDAPSMDIAWPELSGLSADSSETILALGMIALHTSVIVSAQNHILLAESEEEATPPTRPVLLPDGQEEWVDWTNIAEDLGEWADFAFQEVRAYLAEPIKEDKGPRAGVTARANELLRDYILDDDGGLSSDLGGMEFEVFGSVLQVHRIQVYGLDTISDLDVLRPSAPQVLENSFKLETLNVLLQLSIKENEETPHEPITVSYTLRDVSVQMDAILGLNLNELGNVPLGSIFDIGNMVFCLFSGVEALDLTNLSVTFGAIDDPVIDGYFSIGTADSLDWIIESLFDKYRADLLAAAPIFFDTTLRGILSANSPTFVETMRKECPLPTPYGASGFVDLRDLLLSETASSFLGGKGDSPYGNLFRTIYDKLTEEVFRNGASNRPLLNDLLRVLTEKQSNSTGSVNFAGNVMDTFANIKIAGLEAVLGLTISDVVVQNLDSLGDPLDLFRPINEEPFVLNNTISFGVDSKPVGLTARISLTMNDGADLAIQNEVEISLSIEDVILMGSVLLKMAENALAAFPMRDITNYNCWLATLLSRPQDLDEASERGISLIDQSYSIGNFSLDMSCSSCSSPDFDVLLASLYIPENVTELEALINDSIESLSGAEVVEVLLDQLVKDSAKQCPHRPEYDPDADGSSFLRSPGDALGFSEMTEPGRPSVYFTITNATIAGLLFIIGIVSWFCVRRRNKKWIKSLDREGAILLTMQQRKEREMEAMLNSSTTSMFRSPHIPQRIRGAVPFAIIINIALYIGGHLGVLSTVNIDASVAGEAFTIEKFLQFSFIDSTWETYKNGGAEMAILMWVFTGIWPYIKLLLSLLLWMTPPQYLSVKRRGRILLWIDALAKLSVIDIFTMVLGLAIILVFIGGPDESYLGEGVLYSMKAVVIPRAGFYCLVIAQRMSRVSSRFFLEYHTQIIDQTMQANERKQLLNSIPQDQTESSSRSSLINYGKEAPERANEDTPPSTRNNDDIPPLLATTSFDTEESSMPALRLDPFEDEASGVQHGTTKEEEEEEEEEVEAEKDILSSKSVEFRWGTIGVGFGAVTILSVFVIGCIFAPAISLDASSFAGLAVESGLTYEEAVSEYGVFLVASGILVNARFVLNTRADYIGLGLLLIAAVTSLAMVFFIQAYLFIKRKLKERRQGGRPKGPEYGHKGCGLPLYLRQYKWRHMEIYLISVAIGVWQLGSITSYAIHLYCDTMRRIYEVLAFAGLVEESTAQCFRIQTTLPGNVLIMILSFSALMIIFTLQMKAQYKSNIKQSLRWIDDADVPRLSLAWSRDKSKNSRYSHLLTASRTWDGASDEQSLPQTPSTRALTLAGTPEDSRTALQGLQAFNSAGSVESRMESMEPPFSSRSAMFITPPRRKSSVRFNIDQHRQHEQSSSYRSVMSDPSSSQQETEGSSSIQEPPQGLLQSYLEMPEEAPSNGAYVVIPANIEVVSSDDEDDEDYYLG